MAGSGQGDSPVILFCSGEVLASLGNRRKKRESPGPLFSDLMKLLFRELSCPRGFYFTNL